MSWPAATTPAPKAGDRRRSPRWPELHFSVRDGTHQASAVRGSQSALRGTAAHADCVLVVPGMPYARVSLGSMDVVGAGSEAAQRVVRGAYVRAVPRAVASGKAGVMRARIYGLASLGSQRARTLGRDGQPSGASSAAYRARARARRRNRCRNASEWTNAPIRRVLPFANGVVPSRRRVHPRCLARRYSKWRPTI